MGTLQLPAKLRCLCTIYLPTPHSNLSVKTQEKKISKPKTTVKQLSSALLHISHHEYTLVARVVGWVCQPRGWWPFATILSSTARSTTTTISRYRTGTIS